MDIAILIIALLFVAFVALGAYATVKAVGAAKRGVDRTVAQARRAVEDTTLRARQIAQPGPQGQLAELRLSLRTSMRATQDVLRAGRHEDASLAEAQGLFERLSTHGRELDDELRRLEREPDRTSLAARLPDLRERTHQIIGHADSLRWAAQDRAQRFADDDLSTLGTQIDIETGALRHWKPATSAAASAAATPSGASASPGASESSSASGSASRSGSPSASGPAPASPSSPTPTWPDVSQPGAASQEPPPAITARDPREQRAPYPWEKAARRPESTT
ncbi:hypothetical protein [Streptomyces sp. NPDC047108]|uniref:hypothetical protein n=1 Tax=Streptomyces sp. NPDC047108 TaxID=3155025 RepID=UPI0033D52E1E